MIDIAIGSGFESSEAFSRAFKSIYKVSPIEYRKIELMYLLVKEKIRVRFYETSCWKYND